METPDFNPGKNAVRAFIPFYYSLILFVRLNFVHEWHATFEKSSNLPENFLTITLLAKHSDLDLVVLMRQGDRQAFNEIYDRYSLKLYVAAVKRLKSKDDAKDLVQDLFLTLWIKRDSLIIKRSLSSYLFTAIKYRVINFIESNLVKEDYLNSFQKALLDYDNSTNEGIVGRDLEVFIESGINALSPRVKEVFELSRKENLSISEISAKLHVSDQTVKNQISKAIKILKLHLSGTSAILPFIMSLYC